MNVLGMMLSLLPPKTTGLSEADKQSGCGAHEAMKARTNKIHFDRLAREIVPY